MDFIESFLATIFQNDAKEILSDLLGQPWLAKHFMGCSEAQKRRAIRHVVSILEECYRAGHLKIKVNHQDDRLYGYAIFFVHSDPAISRYCHKIFVFKLYRGHGIGSQLLNDVLDDSQGACLLCNHDMIPFYERAGLEFKGSFTAPTAQQGFALTRNMYADLALMGSPGIEGKSPVFMLNDDDIKQILAI